MVSLFPAIETALLSGQSAIISLLSKLQKLIQERSEKFFIGHIRGHSNFSGHLSGRNNMADILTEAMIMTALEQAINSHALHHQNALALKIMFLYKQRTSKMHCKRLFSLPSVI